MMYEEDIAKVNDWFDSRPEESYGTYREGREYSLDEFDIEEFKCFLRENFPDLVGIKCYFGTGDSAIWFYKEDLENADFY